MTNRYPWRPNTTPNTADQDDPRYETPGGAQHKSDTAEANAKEYTANFVSLPVNIAKHAVTREKIYPGAIGGEQLDPALLQNYGDIAVQGKFQQVDEQLADAFNSAPSILKLPLSKPYRGWQGVAVDSDLIYVFTDRDESFSLENIISVYSIDGKIKREIRNAYIETDPQGKFMSFGDGNVINGYLYITAYNINSGGSPLISRVVQYSLPDLNIVGVHEIGSNVAESVTFHDGAFWAVYHDVLAVRKFDVNFSFIQEYPLTIDSAPYGYFQGTYWDGSDLYANLHGHNSNGDDTPFAELRRFTFTGSDFYFVEKITPPTEGCSQGLAYYKGRFFWNDRPNNTIVVTNYIRKGNVYSTDFPYQSNQSFKPALLNDWEAFDAVYDRPPRVTVSGGIVYFSGMVKNTVNANAFDGFTTIFKLPSRYAPKYSINLNALSDKGPIRIPVVGKNQGGGDTVVGNVNAQNIMGYTEIGWLSLDGLSFPILS